MRSRRSGSAAHRAAPGRRRTVPLAYPLLGLVALLPLLPVLVLPYVPTIDGPAHVLDAYVLARYDDPDQAALRQAYVVTAAPTPNLLSQVLLASLLGVLSPASAEKVYVVAVVALFGVAAAYAVRAVSRRNSLLAALAAPLATGYFFYFGFYNFVLGTGLFLLTTGYVLRHRGTWTPRRTAVLLVLLMLTASAHLLPFGMAALTIGMTVLVDLVTAARQDRADSTGTARRLPRALRQQVLPLVAAMVLPAALSVLFLLRSDNVQGLGTEELPTSTGPSAFSVNQLLRSSIGLVTVYTWQELGLGLLLLTGLAVLLLLGTRDLLRERRRSAPVPPLLVPLVAMLLLCVALYTVFPSTVGTLAYIRPRFGLFAVLFAVLVVAALPQQRRAATAASCIAVVVAVGLPIVRHAPQRAVVQDLQEYASVSDVLPRGSTFVTFRAWLDTSPVLEDGYYDPTSHQASRVAMASETVQLNHLDGRYDYFPAHFRDLDQLGVLVTDLDEPRQWRRLLEDAPGGTGPDHVLVWGRQRAGAELLQQPDYAEAKELLDAQYRRIWVSEPAGLLEAYRRR